MLSTCRKHSGFVCGWPIENQHAVFNVILEDACKFVKRLDFEKSPPPDHEMFQ